MGNDNSSMSQFRTPTPMSGASRQNHETYTSAANLYESDPYGVSYNVSYDAYGRPFQNVSSDASSYKYARSADDAIKAWEEDSPEMKRDAFQNEYEAKMKRLDHGPYRPEVDYGDYDSSVYGLSTMYKPKKPLKGNGIYHFDKGMGLDGTDVDYTNRDGPRTNVDYDSGVYHFDKPRNFQNTSGVDPRTGSVLPTVNPLAVIPREVRSGQMLQVLFNQSHDFRGDVDHLVGYQEAVSNMNPRAMGALFDRQRLARMYLDDDIPAIPHKPVQCDGL